MLNRPSKAAIVPVGIIVALLAAIAVSLWLLLPGGFLQAQEACVSGDDAACYAENSDAPVRSFTSMDPEGDSIEWDVRGVDAADFKISSTGVLEFKSPPDFENPTARPLAQIYDSATHAYTTVGAITDPGNVYRITVSATEIRNNRPDNTLPAKRTDIDLTITVTNVDEPGVVKLEWLQPEVGTMITATLTDPDNPDGTFTGAPPSYVWTVSKVADPDVETSFHWNPATGTGNTGDTYTPAGVRVDGSGTATDEERYLRVTVTYEDTLGDDKKAVVKSMLPVRAEVSSGAAQAPADNGSPDFASDTDTRTVLESLAVHSAVGAAFRAIEPDREDVLTYTLHAVVEDDNTNDMEADDVNSFYIDNLDENGDITGTGQIKVKGRLDFETKLDANGDADGKYYVIVRATDPSSESDDLTVTITAENVNEAPSVAGYVALTVREGITDAADMFVYNDLPLGDNLNEHEYIATEPDLRDTIRTWQLEGDDASMFDLSGHNEPRYLNFKELADYPAPDYENPRDENQDNVYEVTIVATDNDLTRGSIDVTVVVDNVDEPGKVVFTEGKLCRSSTRSW